MKDNKRKKGKRRRKQRRNLRNIGILAAVFLLAVVIFSYTTNKENNNIAADLGAAARPQVSFSYNGYGLNALPVYAKEMDITAVRDTITPVTNGRLEMGLKKYNNDITGLVYEVYTLDGADKLFEDKVENPGESVSLDFSGEELLREERVLKLILKSDGEKQFYMYTRIVDAEGMNALECLDYVRDFHENAMAKAEDAGVGLVLEPNEESDNTTFQHVTIHSDYDHVSWGELEPQVEGGERYHITEMNSMYMSIVIEYRVRCKGEENETDVYNVKEFFRVRYVSEEKKHYLLDYDRTMEQIFDAAHTVLDDQGVILGIAESTVPYMANQKGTIVSFVQADELWNYNKDNNEVSLIFSFADAENTDVRNLFSRHEIRLLKMENNGNLVFAVYGYMNRGEHEGEVGVAVYYYELENNSVEEKIFISSNKSYERVAEELGELVYYSVEQDMLYVLVDGTFYEINVDKETISELVSELSDNQYIASPDGHLAAYPKDKETNTSITVKNFSDGKERTVECAEGERLIPLGFIKEDFVYGVSRTADSGQTVAGQEVFPMYKVEIEDEKGEPVKSYEQSGIYILGAEFEDDLITLSCAEKKGSAYNSVADDYITNNEEKGENMVYAETYVTQLKETQMRLVFEKEMKNREPKLLKPKQTLREDHRTVDFTSKDTKNKCYVYGYGKLQGSYDNAGEAIQNADAYNGVVVSEWQTYIWQRGNRDLEYNIPGKNDEIEKIRTQLNSGKSPVSIMEEISDGKMIDLTGCTPEQLLYIVNQDIPVIAMLDTKTAVIITGYGDGSVTYKEAKTGAVRVVSYKGMAEMTEDSGNTYVAYVK